MAKTGSRNETSASVVSLIRMIHGASVNADDWPGVLEQLRKYLDASVLTLRHHKFTTGSESALFESPDSMGFNQDMASFSARNPWFLSSYDYVPGRVMTGDELISDSDLRRTDFYRGFLQPRGLLHLLCGVVDQRAHGAHCLSAYRTEDQGAFDEREKAELTLLLDHITLSLENQWRWQEANDLAHALLALNNDDTNPTILVTSDGEPIYRNSAADLLLEQRHGLCLDRGYLAAVSVADQRLLSRAIASVVESGPEHATAQPCVLTLACRTPNSPVVVVVRAAGQVFARQAGVRRGLAMLSVRGSNAGHDPATCVFARQYELTAAQARVSALVFAGQSLSMISDSLNVSENTVRSHLKQVFQKTETHGQMELVHLHARVCVALP